MHICFTCALGKGFSVDEFGVSESEDTEVGEVLDVSIDGGRRADIKLKVG